MDIIRFKNKMDSEHIKQAIKTNKIKYRKYKDITEPYHIHDFKWYSCMSAAIAGERKFLRRLCYLGEYKNAPL